MAGNPQGIRSLAKYSRLSVERIKYVPDADATTVRSINRGVLFLMAFWSGPSVQAFAKLTEVLARLDAGDRAQDVEGGAVRDAERRGAHLDLTALDRSEQMLEIARRRTGAHPRLRFVAADGTALPFADGAFDVVICTLALHHFEPDAARALLREVRRVARLTPLRAAAPSLGYARWHA